MTVSYKFFAFDDSCHLYTSSNLGQTWVESETPPDTMTDDWSDLHMAVNDGDYKTMVSFNTNYRAGIVGYDLSDGRAGISKTAGLTGSWTISSPQGVSPVAGIRFNSGAISGNATIILAMPEAGTVYYPRLSTNGGVTWANVQPSGTDKTFYGRAAFGQNGTIMYITKPGSGIWKSSNSGATWAALSGSPVPPTGAAGPSSPTSEMAMRLRCSQNGSVIALAQQDSGTAIQSVHTSRNGGTSWTSQTLSDNTSFPVSLRNDVSMSLDGSVMLAVCQSSQRDHGEAAVFVSRDSGATWTDITSRVTTASNDSFKTIESCAVSPDGQAMFIVWDSDSTLSTFVDVSTDGGVTWTQRTMLLTVGGGGGAGTFVAAFIVPFETDAAGIPTDGTLIGATYRRTSAFTTESPAIIGWHEHALGHSRVLTSIGASSDTGGLLDHLDMVTTDGQSYFVEGLTQIFDEDDALQDAWFVDGGLVPDSAYEDTVSAVKGIRFTGLWLLNGATVAVWALGLDLGDYVVDENGTLFVPYGSGTAPRTFDYMASGAGAYLFTADYIDSALQPTDVRNGGVPYLSKFMPCCIGFAYTSEGQTLRPISMQDTGARTGPALGSIRRAHMLKAILQTTLGIAFGTEFGKLNTAELKDEAGTQPTPTQPFSGVWRETLEDDYGLDSMVAWQIVRPYPASVVSIGASVVTQDS